jgi:hypothetical protein
MKSDSKSVPPYGIHCKQFDLIGGKLIAGDSTKRRAQNSRKNNFNEAKITQHLAYIERRLDEYNQALEVADERTEKLFRATLKSRATERTNTTK